MIRKTLERIVTEGEIPSNMAVWTKAKLAEATGLNSVVLGGAIPFTATNFCRYGGMADTTDPRKRRGALGFESQI